MRRFSVVIFVVLSACGCSGNSGDSAAGSGRTGPANAQFELVGKWSDSQGNQVYTVFTQMTDRQDLSAYAKKLAGRKGRIICVEFYNDKARTPNPAGTKTIDEAIAMCNTDDLRPMRVATYRADPESGEKFSMVTK